MKTRHAMVLFALIASPALGQATYLTADRYIQTTGPQNPHAFPNYFSQRTSANGFLPFLASRNDVYVPGFGGGLPATVTQSSMLTPASIQLSGTTSAIGTFMVGGGLWGGVTSTIYFDVTFSIMSSQTYNLFGTSNSHSQNDNFNPGNPVFSGVHHILFERVGGPKLFERRVPQLGTTLGAFNNSALIGPGTYRLFARIENPTGGSLSGGMGNIFHTNNGAVDLTLMIPSPAAASVFCIGAIGAIRRRR